MKAAMNRRQVLGGIAVGTGAACVPQLGLAAVPQAGNRRLVLVILRGALDGLAAVQPWNDPHLVAHRAPLLVPEAQLLKLDSYFALHPAFSHLHGLYQQKQAEIFHAIATPYRERSHFDGQNVLETGLSAPHPSAPGWLNQAVALMDVQGLAPAAMALSATLPKVLQGDAQVGSWAPDTLPQLADPAFGKLSFLYALDSFLGPRLQQGMQSELLASGGSMPSATYANPSLAELARSAARFLAQPDGPVIAVLQTGHVWDTHVNQGAAQGQLATRIGELDAALAALHQELGSWWQHTQVLVVTEFGRNVAANGNGGTDHGIGSVAFRLGGAVQGGRIVTDWPGLAPGQLYEGKDLQATTDLRALFEEAALHVLAG